MKSRWMPHHHEQMTSQKIARWAAPCAQKMIPGRRKMVMGQLKTAAAMPIFLSPGCASVWELVAKDIKGGSAHCSTRCKSASKFTTPSSNMLRREANSQISRRSGPYASSSSRPANSQKPKGAPRRTVVRAPTLPQTAAVLARSRLPPWQREPRCHPRPRQLPLAPLPENVFSLQANRRPASPHALGSSPWHPCQPSSTPPGPCCGGGSCGDRGPSCSIGGASGAHASK